MTCSLFKRLVDAYVDSELDGAEAMEVWRHADHCPDCARELARARYVKVKMEEGAGHGLPDGLEERILLATTGSVSPAAKPEVLRRPVWAWGLTAAAAAAFAIMAIALLRPTPAPPPTTASAAEDSIYSEGFDPLAIPIPAPASARTASFGP